MVNFQEFFYTFDVSASFKIWQLSNCYLLKPKYGIEFIASAIHFYLEILLESWGTYVKPGYVIAFHSMKIWVINIILYGSAVCYMVHKGLGYFVPKSHPKRNLT